MADTDAAGYPTNRHDLDILGRELYEAYAATGEAHNKLVNSLPLRLRLVDERMRAEHCEGDYDQADVDAILAWWTGTTATAAAHEEAKAAFEALSAHQRMVADEESRRRKVDDARNAAAANLRAARDAELRELAAGHDAVRRLTRLEGEVRDVVVLTNAYRGLKSIERNDRGLITSVVRAPVARRGHV